MHASTRRHHHPLTRQPEQVRQFGETSDGAHSVLTSAPTSLTAIRVRITRTGVCLKNRSSSGGQVAR